jgi:hypothetical protein
VGCSIDTLSQAAGDTETCGSHAAGKILGILEAGCGGIAAADYGQLGLMQQFLVADKKK